jgi:hypothetical protein
MLSREGQEGQQEGQEGRAGGAGGQEGEARGYGHRSRVVTHLAFAEAPPAGRRAVAGR